MRAAGRVLFFFCVCVFFVVLVSTGDVQATTILRQHHHGHHRHQQQYVNTAAAASASASDVDAANQADCLLRNMVLTAAGMIQPTGFATNWSSVAYSALELATLCPNTEPVQPAAHLNMPARPPAEPYSTDAASCDLAYYVATNGSDVSSGGTLAAPFATLTYALAMVRFARAVAPQATVSPCIYLRAGTYYLGESLPPTAGSSSDSQFGAIDLLPSDSGLMIAAYPGESVTLSGGARITPSWQVYAKTTAGTIYSTKLTPTNPSAQLLTDSFHLNEMFVDGTRAVRAKWPNGDPSTHGLYSTPTGFDQSSMAWLRPVPRDHAVEVHIAQPNLADDYFSSYQIGVDGPAIPFDPPRSFWAMANPPGGGGSTYVVPSGMNTKNTDLAARAANWSNPSTGYAHVFHGGAWGSWVFSFASYDAQTNELQFAEGGFQEARGAGSGGAFYVEWLIEELDDGFEWFFDESSQTLYFMPNGTGIAPPTELVVSQLPCILSAHGDSKSPVANVLLSGLTFSHTSNTKMRSFEVPSGGDWSLHRGGAVFFTGTAYTVVQNSVFSFLGGTGVVISDWNLGTEVTTSEFVWGGDSGVVVIGSQVGIDAVSYTNQPDLVRVTNSLFHELGIYIKQSAPVLLSLARSATVSGNLIFNLPRAGVNINDPFYGNHTIAGNVMFNTVRETSDHGPINSWDRLPFLTLQQNTTTGEWAPSLDPAITHINHNLLFNNYHSVWPIDHDDGSRRYDDAFNVLVYGGFKNYLGNSKSAHDSVYIYPDGPHVTMKAGAGASAEASDWLTSVDRANRERRRRADALAAGADPTIVNEGWGVYCVQSYYSVANSIGWNEHWYNNTCAMWSMSQAYAFDSCKIGNLANFIPFLSNNRLYFQPGLSAQIPCTLANGTAATLGLADLQAQGYDLGSTEGPLPATSELISLGFQTLFGTQQA